jgi:uncharacterized membrane protein (DUF106 family)
MEVMYKSITKFVFTLLILAMPVLKVHSQSSLPDDLVKSSLPDQMKYLEERTRIYENYRAIREDMFQKLKHNVIDSVTFAHKNIIALRSEVKGLNSKIDSLDKTLASTKEMLDEMTTTKNSMKVLGMEVNKASYNGLMWTIIAVLVCLLVFGFIAFRSNVAITQKTRRELEELKDEFEGYRKTSREAREKMSMDHFNELRRLRGG